jgi:hypothetical protein
MPPPPPESNPQQRITHCAICQYELTDQPTTYIPDYHFIATRCPECGQQQPAGITTQPWGYRKLKYALMLTLWLIFLFTTIIAAPIAYASMAQSTAYAAVHPLAKHITQLQATSDTKYHVARWDGSFNPSYELNKDWWEERGSQLARETYSPSKHLYWIVFTDWLWFLLISPAIALLFYALLHKASLTTKLLTATASLIIASLFTYLAMSISGGYLYILRPQDAAMQIAAAPIGWSTFIFGLLTTLIAYALTPKLLKVFNQHFRNLPKEPATS